jgi:hypothetical protein
VGTKGVVVDSIGMIPHAKDITEGMTVNEGAPLWPGHSNVSEKMTTQQGAIVRSDCMLFRLSSRGDGAEL